MESKLLPLTSRGAEPRLHDALSDPVVFHSPVRDYHGRADMIHSLMTIGGVPPKIQSRRRAETR